MPATLPISVLDVFAERPLAGNQLAVVHDAAVRIFTPINELPFAGHPTIGTAWALTGGAGNITLDLGVGPVPVHFEDGIGWLQPPEVTFQGELSRQEAAALIGLAEDHLAGDFSFVFTSEAYSDDAQFTARMIFDVGGLREDPATGSANAAVVSAGWPGAACGRQGTTSP